MSHREMPNKPRGRQANEGMLIALRGPLAGKEFLLLGDEILLGRDNDCDIVMNDLNASRRHALLYRRSGTCYVEDQQSKNGLFLNGKAVHSATLRDGDQLRIGDSTFRFSSGRAPQRRT